MHFKTTLWVPQQTIGRESSLTIHTRLLSSPLSLVEVVSRNRSVAAEERTGVGREQRATFTPPVFHKKLKTAPPCPQKRADRRS